MVPSRAATKKSTLGDCSAMHATNSAWSRKVPKRDQPMAPCAAPSSTADARTMARRPSSVNATMGPSSVA